MELDWKNIITKNGIPILQTVLIKSNIQGSIISLAVWGILNTAAWFFFGAENREFVKSFNHISSGLYFLLYGGLVIGTAQLACAVYGFLNPSKSIINLDGLSLIIIGTWNTTSIFVAASVLSNYGYYFETSITDFLFFMLGATQITWGVKQFKKFKRFSTWSQAKLNDDRIKTSNEQLNTFIKNGESDEDSIIELIHLKFNIFMGGNQEVKHTGRPIDDSLIFFPNDLEEYFIVDRKKINLKHKKENKYIADLLIYEKNKKFNINGSSATILNNWLSKSPA